MCCVVRVECFFFFKQKTAYEMRISDWSSDVCSSDLSETILRNLRVLATDQRMDALGDDGKPVVQTYSNVTIEVTPKIAEKIAVAQTIGSLSLSLRSLADNSSELDAAIAGSDVDLPVGSNSSTEKRSE